MGSPSLEYKKYGCVQVRSLAVVLALFGVDSGST